MRGRATLCVWGLKLDGTRCDLCHRSDEDRYVYFGTRKPSPLIARFMQVETICGICESVIERYIKDFSESNVITEDAVGWGCLMFMIDHWQNQFFNYNRFGGASMRHFEDHRHCPGKPMTAHIIRAEVRGE